MFYFVPTPIGNMEDITLRTLKLFKECKIIICEDALKTSQLLKLLEIENKPRLVMMMKNHNFNEKEILTILKNDLNNSGENSQTILVASDAGMPGISDPGYLIIKLLQKNNHPYTVLPGANALLPAVVASGLVVKDFVFLGFLPLKKGRQKAILNLKNYEIPVVLYESNHRIKKLLNELLASLDGKTEIFIAREISKKFETFYLENLEKLPIENIKEKGEFVVVIKNAK